jgi:ankyrin repeat protein
MTPLHYAARCGNLEVCKLILSNVKDPNPVYNDGRIPKNFARDKNIQKLFDS